MKISDLAPTESRLLLNPYKLNGRDLAISCIKEMLFLKYLRTEEKKIDRLNVSIIKVGERSNENTEGYKKLILNCLDSHYRHYPDPVDKDSALTPDKLLRDVYGAIDFNYQKFKRKYFYRKLYKYNLLKAYFPFYLLRIPYTKKGKAIKAELKNLVNELELYYRYYADTDKQKLKDLVKKLGPNVLLAYNIEVIMKELSIMSNTDLDFKKDETLRDIFFFEFLEMGFFEMSWHLSDLPSFELPDISFGDLFDFN